MERSIEKVSIFKTGLSSATDAHLARVAKLRKASPTAISVWFLEAMEHTNAMPVILLPKSVQFWELQYLKAHLAYPILYRI